MNIFFLSLCIRRCARYHFDKHVVKMIVELCQLLCTAWHILDPELSITHDLYRKTHFNHPCAVWVRKHVNNYMYVVKLGLELCKEWRFRYGHPETKLHACESKLIFLKSNPPPSIPTFTIKKSKHNPLRFTLPMPQAMPEECKYKPEKKSAICCILAYRRYYMSEHKLKLRSWTRLNSALHAEPKFLKGNLNSVDVKDKKRVELEQIHWWKM